MSILLEAAGDAAIWSSGRGTLAVVFGLLAAAAAFNNPLWKEPETAKIAATAAQITVKDASACAWFGCMDVNAFSLYQTKVRGVDSTGREVEVTICRTAFSSDNQVIQRKKVTDQGMKKHERSVTHVRVVNGTAVLN